ncbi:hypothetical protein FSP39_017752 [Pinctada imbricata]|uniref:FAS1 domain-containing protein n=1 Tax=Pinctada imbricata TaxID=66713 RepID=A0AA88YK73_PINIB|nr:hypothetical protein FSP39_017752 [Pinctada imbricata]
MLVKFVQDADLTGALSGEGPFTVFAPTDKAFNALPKDVIETLMSDKALLKSVLEYHVLNGETLSSDLSNDLTVDTLDEGRKIRINIYGNKVFATGSQVILADQKATNGVIHVLDKVMYPIPTMSILETAASTPSLSTLVYAVTMAKLQETLAGGPFTIFAPNNPAFDKLPPGKLSDLLSNETALTGTFYSRGLENNEKVPTVEKKDVTVKLEGGDVMINDAKVISADLSETNGVVHVIDTVLVPPE